MKKTIITFTILFSLVWVGAAGYINYALNLREKQIVAETTVNEPKQPTLEESRVELFNGLNTVRSTASVPTVVLAAELNTAAQEKCDDLVASGAFAHDGNNKLMDVFIRQYFPYGKAGENLATGEANLAKVTNDWVNSPEHYKNMVDPLFTKVGFGVCTYTHGHYTDEDSDFDLNGLRLYVEAFAS
jgi:uncharacterized protein YkwD